MNTVIDKDDAKVRLHLKRFVQSRMDELQLTQADLARLTGDGESQISKIRHGLNTPSLAFCVRLQKALQCSIDDLAGIRETVES